MRANAEDPHAPTPLRAMIGTSSDLLEFETLGFQYRRRDGATKKLDQRFVRFEHSAPGTDPGRKNGHAGDFSRERTKQLRPADRYNFRCLRNSPLGLAPCNDLCCL